MPRRRIALTILGAWLGLSLLRLVANIASGAMDEFHLTTAQLAALSVIVAYFWVPVALFVVWFDGRPRRLATLIVTHIGGAAAVIVAEPLWVDAIVPSFGLPREYLGTLISRLDINVLVYAVIVASDVVWRRLQAVKLREVAAAKLEQTLVDVQLHALALQLQPHFLFNALQFVAETAHNDLEAARRTLGIIRRLVEQAFALESRVEVTVAEEISFLRDYAEIQRSRFGDRFSMAFNVDDAAITGGIPPLLLQPLVENASRHGFARRGSGGHIEVIVKRTRRNELSIVVADDGVGLSGQLREGQGLSVTRRRLERLYGNDAHLALARASDGRTESRIRVPFRELGTETSEPGFENTPGHREAESDDGPTVPNSQFSVHDQFPVPEQSRIAAWIARIPFAGRVAAIWLAILALVIGGTWGTARYIYWSKLPETRALFLDELVGLPFWVALTAIAVIAARRLSGRWAMPIHAFLALLVAVVHAALGNTVARVVWGVQQPAPGFSHWGTWDVLVYVGLVLVIRSQDLGSWMRAKMREEVTLNEEVVKATGRLARFREMQSLLLMSLDDVIESPTMETLDRSVVDFADFLRFDVMGGVE
jgi:hypothetical protein